MIAYKKSSKKFNNFAKHSQCIIHFLFSAKLPKWFGERPGKKAGEPESPDDEDEAAGDAPVDAGDDEEEEEEEEEEE